MDTLEHLIKQYASIDKRYMSITELRRLIDLLLEERKKEIKKEYVVGDLWGK